MKKIFFILFIPIIFSCNACNVTSPDRLPFSCLPIDNTEDVIVIENPRSQTRDLEILAIDTKKSELVYVCPFKTDWLIGCTSQLTNSGYYYIQLPSDDIFCLNIKTGTAKKITRLTVWDILLAGDDLVFSNHADYTDSYRYNPHTNKLTQFRTLGAISSDVCINNGNEYYTMFDREKSKFDWNVVNHTTNKQLTLNYDKEPFQMKNNKYIGFEENGGYALHEIVSFEPENIIKICQLPNLFPDSIAEDENYIYASDPYGVVCKISKSSKQIVAQSEEIQGHKGAYSVIRNGYAWIGAGLGSGDFYRIELADDDGDGVLKCELFKNK